MLILWLARKNPTWGYGKLEGELSKLGYAIGRSTVCIQVPIFEVTEASHNERKRGCASGLHASPNFNWMFTHRPPSAGVACKFHAKQHPRLDVSSAHVHAAAQYVAPADAAHVGNFLARRTAMVGTNIRGIGMLRHQPQPLGQHIFLTIMCRRHHSPDAWL
jgi:hypothetical protein